MLAAYGVAAMGREDRGEPHLFLNGGGLLYLSVRRC
jgi:hypothetical protein